jgi:Zn finger protein HypA/HybF involved in hydrogenase expression
MARTCPHCGGALGAAKAKPALSRRRKHWNEAFDLNTCPDCGHKGLHWETFAGMRLARLVEQRKHFRAKCPACHAHFDAIDGGKGE